MAYRIKSKAGRKRVEFKIRNAEPITPKGFKFHKVKGNAFIFKRIKKLKKE
jgi:hypothetical protein